jgi:nitrilase
MAKAAVIQMVSDSSSANNLKQVEGMIKQAALQGAQLVLLPENFAWMGGAEADKQAVAEVFGAGPIQECIAKMARKYHLWIVAGTLFLKTASHRVRAASLVFDETGHCVARYDKIHLFDVRVSSQEAHQESATIEPGNAIAVVDSPVGRLGLSVCYDVRFPELYRQMVLQGATLFAIPAAFTATTGLAHWEVLLRARAVENLCYVLAANQGGTHENGRQTYGHSMIVEPWGGVLGEVDQGEGMAVAEIDLQRLDALRKQFPCNEHHVLGA